MPPTNFSRLTSSPVSWPRKACAVAVGPWAAAIVVDADDGEAARLDLLGQPGQAGRLCARRLEPIQEDDARAVADARQTVDQALGDQALGQNIVFALDVRGGRQKERSGR